MVEVLGNRDELLRLIEERFKSDILVRGNEITVSGGSPEVDQVATVFEELLALLDQGQQLNAQSVSTTIDIVTGSEEASPSKLLDQTILSHRGKTIRPRTAGQRRYVDAIDKTTLTFAIGPAGTGKTYLAMAKAVQALKDKLVSRIILTRPVVEAGESLGFLPGDLYQKINPYLRPLYDALHDMMDVEQYQRLMDRGTIEVAPLAYMRGRTLNDSFVILDEAQNTTPQQMKMFLTRLGFGSKVVVTGDITQVDLGPGEPSGLRVIAEILKGVRDIEFIRLTGKDVVRHELVQRIVDAYGEFEAGQMARTPVSKERHHNHRAYPSATDGGSHYVSEADFWASLDPSESTE